MYEVVSLKVKCPVCMKSLMSSEKLVDDKPGIHMLLEVSGHKGSIFLSSIYGSYNYDCDLHLEPGVVANFFCPHCQEQLNTEEQCQTCEAPMVAFYLQMGGKASFCSRNGCKSHFVEFDDTSVALRRMYEEFDLEGTQHHVSLHEVHTHEKTQPPKKDEEVEILKSGTFLYSYCPHCRRSLIDKGKLRLRIRKDQTGDLLLNPFLNVFTSECTIVISEDQVVEEVSCTHCNENLIDNRLSCGKCGSPVARIMVSARTKFIDFYLCTKKGCRWHGLHEEDMYEIRLEDSLEW